MVKIGFIGVGNIASTIIKGLSNTDLDIKLLGFNHNHVNAHVKELTDQKLITMSKSLNELVNDCDYIICCVKPDVIDSVLSDIDKSLINDSKVFISVAAKVPLEHYAKLLSDNVKIIRTMPNVNAAVKESMTAICPNNNVNKDNLNFVVSLFNQVGKTIIIKENILDIFMAIAGSFPAVVFMIIEAIANAGTKFGMSKQQASEIAAQTILGSSIYAQQNGVNKNKDVGSLMDTVMPPKGTTINGIEKLEENNFSSIIEEAIIAMMKPKNEK